MPAGKLIIDGHGTERIIYPPIELPRSPGIVRPEPVTFDEALEWNKHYQEFQEKTLIFTQEYAQAKREPIGNSNKIDLVNVCDIHYGSMYVDYDFLKHCLETIEYTPNMYGIFTWNLLDAAIPGQFPDGLLWNGMTAQNQVYTFKEELKRLHSKGKIIAAIGEAACHEGWGTKKMGWMIYRELFEGMDDIPLLTNGGVLDIQVGGQVYRAGLFHKTRYWSTLNKTHGGERIMDRIADCELAFTSHMHKAGVARGTRYNPPFRKATAIVAGGSCKLKDRWLRGHIGEEGEPGFQSVTLWADSHGMEVVFDLDKARENMLDAIKEGDSAELERLREELRSLSTGGKG